MKSSISNCRQHAAARFVGLFLAVEFVDELVDSFVGASWPFIRSDLSLSYSEVGILITLPYLFGCIVEFFLGIVADRRFRPLIMLSGGVLFITSLLAIAGSSGFAFLLFGFMTFNPASGAFVSLSQACLMDLYPTRREQMMVRWTFAGTLAHLIGPVVFVAFAETALGWRGCCLAAALVTLPCLGAMFHSRATLPTGTPTEETVELITAMSSIASEVMNPAVLKWVATVEATDLMLDILTGFLTLYLVDVIGLSVEHAALLLLLRACSSAAGELFVVLILERIRGMNYLVWSSFLTTLAYIQFLRSTSLPFLATSLCIVTLATSGWYSILKAKLYGCLPNRSGSVMSITAVMGLVRGLVPAALGLVADAFGLTAAMWILLIGAGLVFAVSLRETKVIVR